MNQELLNKLLSDIQIMTNNQLIDYAAGYNANIRRGHKLVADGQIIIKSNIDLFVACQNELHARLARKIENETNRLFK